MPLDIRALEIEGYEKVIYAEDNSVGLRSFIALHSTVMGPAVGGTRIYPYSSSSEALRDVLRLAKGMTYKSALAECGFGGGKSVLICDPKTDKTPELLRSFAELVNLLEGKYLCAEDSGCRPEDVIAIRGHTPYVVGLSLPGSSGNPSPYTAWGTLRGIQAALKYLDDNDSLEGKVVAVQGVGAVGLELCEMLFWQGAKLIVSDVDQERLSSVKEKFDAIIVSPEEILESRCDVFVPCAMGGILNSDSIEELHCRAVVGCANNQLELPEDAYHLKRKGILYAPDFLVNAGGLINVQMELDPRGYQPLHARNAVDKIYKRLLSVFQIAEKNNYTTDFAALQLAKHRLKYGIGRRHDPIKIHHEAPESLYAKRP